MPRKANKLILNDGDYEYLRSLIKQRTIQAQIVIRAHILLDKSNGMGTRDIARIYDLSPTSVQLCINKYVEGGAARALFVPPLCDKYIVPQFGYLLQLFIIRYTSMDFSI